MEQKGIKMDEHLPGEKRMVIPKTRRGIIVHAAVVRLPLGTLEEIILLPSQK